MLGRVPTEIELILEHTQQGISYEVLGTLKGKWRYLIPDITPIHNHVLIPNYQDLKIQDFCYSDGFECFQAINIGSLLQIALDTYATLTSRIEKLESNKLNQALEIIKLKKRVKRLEKGYKVKVFKIKRLKKVGTSKRVETSDDTIMEDVSNQGRMIVELDRDKGIELMGEKEEEKKTEQAKDMADDDQVEGRQAEIQAEIYQIDLDHPSKVLSMQEDEPAAEVEEVVEVVTTTKLVTTASTPVSAASITILAVKPQLPATTPTIILVAAAYTRRQKGVVIRDPEEESTTIKPDTKSKDKGKGKVVEEPKPLKKSNKLTKRRKLNKEVKDDKDLKQHLEIVPDDDDDVYTEATPLARKVPVVDYQIVQEDLESLWSIVKERFSTSKPNNFLDDYLLTTLRAMFGRPDGQDNVWKSQMTLELMLSWSLKKNTKCFNAAGEELSAVKHKLILLDTAAERRLMLLSHVKTVNEKCCCCRIK
uniref:Uncharacterized protein n=1 Tax=Tanacetum cinerariifolium TaxID=118510 RepID=A0A6L2P0J1_TANCI|nr:hypothetical protein [Tanacetum cinerariifolium]